jgi:hypothetical protein
MKKSKPEDRPVCDLRDVVPKRTDIKVALKLSRLFGDVSFLCAVLKSGLPVSPEDRWLLGDFLWREMRLLRPRGNTRIMRLMNPGSAARLAAAASEFQNLRNAAKKAAQSGLSRADTLAAVAAKYSLDSNKLENRVRRSGRRRPPFPPKSPPRT